MEQSLRQWPLAEGTDGVELNENRSHPVVGDPEIYEPSLTPEIGRKGLSGLSGIEVGSRLKEGNLCQIFGKVKERLRSVTGNSITAGPYLVVAKQIRRTYQRWLPACSDQRRVGAKASIPATNTTSFRYEITGCFVNDVIF